jgi:hypothetical protein
LYPLVKAGSFLCDAGRRIQSVDFRPIRPETGKAEPSSGQSAEGGRLRVYASYFDGT